MRTPPIIIKCRRRIAQGIRTTGERAHLVYFGLVFLSSNGSYAWAAGGCLTLGVLAQMLGEASDA
jgi:hypothetical protein